MNNLGKREAFIDPMSIQGAELKFLPRFLRLSVFLWCRAIPQIVRLKGRETGLEHLLVVFPTLLCRVLVILLVSCGAIQ